MLLVKSGIKEPVQEWYAAEDNVKQLSDLIVKAESLHASFGVFFSLLTALKDEAMFRVMADSSSASVQMKEREARAIIAPITRRLEYMHTAIDTLASKVVSLRRQVELIGKGGIG